MRCDEFDVLIDEMLSGILHPEASEHMRQCERCTSHFRARSVVQKNLRQLAAASGEGPSRATDRAVMESYRRLQQRRAAEIAPRPQARLFTFPERRVTPFWGSRTLWTGAAAAAMAFAVLGTAVHLWHAPAVNAPVVVVKPANPAKNESASALARKPATALRSAGRMIARRIAPHASPSSPAGVTEVASSESARPVLRAQGSARRPIVFGEDQSFDSGPITKQAAQVSPVMRLASTGATTVAQSASSTWPGYSNLMYCDPVVCSGPMQVVHIKVPVGQVKPNVGQSERNSFVNADVVVGPDGVARAIRVAE